MTAHGFIRPERLLWSLHVRLRGPVHAGRSARTGPSRDPGISRPVGMRSEDTRGDGLGGVVADDVSSTEVQTTPDPRIDRVMVDPTGEAVVPRLARSHRRDEQVDPVGARHPRDGPRKRADRGVEPAGVVRVREGLR